MSRTYLLPLLLLSVLAPRIHAQAAVLPLLECTEAPLPIDDVDAIRSSFLTRFSYFNLLAADAVIPAGGAQNFFSPGNPNLGQPSTFAPGYHRRAFSVITAPRDTLRDTLWLLNNVIADGRTADINTRCPDPSTTPFVTSSPLKLTAGNTYIGLELARLLIAAPLQGTLTLAADVYQGSSGGGTVGPGSDFTVANLRLDNGIIKGDVTAALNPAKLYHILDIRVLLNGQEVAARTSSVEIRAACTNLAIVPTLLPSAVQGQPYGPVSFTASGETAPYAFDLGTSRLPNGMQFANGALSGTPTEAGLFPLSLSATTANGCLSQTSYALTVSGPSCGADVTPQITLTLGGFTRNLATGRWLQTVTIRNASATPLTGPVAIVLANLSANATLYAPSGTTQCAAPAGQPYMLVNVGPDGVLSPSEVAAITLEFVNSTAGQAITYTPRVLAGGQQR